MTTCDLYIVGCGGHGRVILDVFRSASPPAAGADALCFVDDRASLWGTEVDGVPVVGGTDTIPNGARVFLGVGDNIIRRNLYCRLKARGCSFPQLVACTAVVSPAAALDEAVVILHRAVVQTGACIGVNAVINTAAVVEHDCRIGPHVQLAPAVALSGNVTVGEGTLLGTGVSVNRNVTIGEYCLVSPGLPVIHDVPDHSVYKVNPVGIRVEANYRVGEIDPPAREGAPRRRSVRARSTRMAAAPRPRPPASPRPPRHGEER